MEKENISIEKLKLVKNLALEFRLSLANICRLLRIEPTDENQRIIYDELLRKVCDGPDGIREIEYLMYETENESKSDSTVTYNMALLYFTRYVKALKSGDSEQIKNASLNIIQTDINFANLMKNKPDKYSDEDCVTIIKYRIKHAFSSKSFSKTVGIDRKTLKILEGRITNERLIRKTASLNDYYEYLQNLYTRNQRY